jgi:alpha-N-arabinofuranosidase
MRIRRRQFLESAGLAGLAAFASVRTLRAADAEVEVNPSQPGAVISPHIYGHFIEHLGGVIYDGIWVGRDSTT